jgi:hypothetical protein
MKKLTVKLLYLHLIVKPQCLGWNHRYKIFDYLSNNQKLGIMMAITKNRLFSTTEEK